MNDCNDPKCPWCSGSFPMRHPISHPPIKHTTIVIAKKAGSNKNKAFDLGNSEWIGEQYTPFNAFTCTTEEAEKLKAKYK